MIRAARTPSSVHGRTLGVSAENALEMVRRLDEGFPFEAFTRFQRASGLPVGNIARLVDIPPRTLMRRRSRGKLLPAESERLLRLSTIFEQAVDMFEGDADAARKWLTSRNRELGNEAPLEFARTEIGARAVEDLIGRLEHGVFT